MDLAEKLKIDANREGNSLDFWTIYAYKNGKFWTFFNQSAWIMTLFNDFKLNVRNADQLDKKVIHVGFPAESMQKFSPKDFTKRDFPDDPTRFCFVPTDAFLANCMGKTEAIAQYQKWHQEAKPQPKDKKNSRPAGMLALDSDFDLLWLRVMTFQIEEKSPMDCVSFIQFLKKEIAHKIDCNTKALMSTEDKADSTTDNGDIVFENTASK